MKDFAGKVAVITGGASGLGFAFAEAALARGAHVVIADIREDALAAAAGKLSGQGEVLTVQVDVASRTSVEALADEAWSRFGKVNLLFNNAGIFASGVTWKMSPEEYDWVIGVNQKSVIYGIHTFVPRMIDQGDACHVINTASGAGISTMTGFCAYNMTKHAVVALSETLYLDLKAHDVNNVGVTLVMPGVVQTDIMNPDKTSPDIVRSEVAARLQEPVNNRIEAGMRSAVDNGLTAGEAAEMVFGAVERDELYVLPNFTDEGQQTYARNIALGRLTATNPFN